MFSDELTDNLFICQILFMHGKGMYREDLLQLVYDITPYSKQQIKFQYLALIFSGDLIEQYGKVFKGSVDA